MKAVKTSRRATEKIPMAWSQGTKCDLIDPIPNHKHMLQDEYFYFGILRGTGDMLKRSIQNKWDYYSCDHAYFNAGHSGSNPWYRITKNNLISSTMVERSADRYEKFFKQDLLPWRQPSKNNKIVVCPPTGAIEWFYDTQNWLNTTVKTLKQHTSREIIVRDKPMDPQVATKNGITTLTGFNKSVQDKPLDEDLSQAHCVVTFNSNVAVKSITQGIPVICGPECVAHPIANTIENIENLKSFDREPWLHHLAYSQFTLSEISQGYAYEILNV
jgi:hypothetical protein